MTNEDYKNELDWLRNNWPLLGRFEYKPDEAVHTTIGRVAELLYLHAFGCGRLGAAVSASPQPRCPKCHIAALESVWEGSGEHKHFKVLCACGFFNYISSHEQFAQFFAAAPAQEPRCHVCRLPKFTVHGAVPSGVPVSDLPKHFCNCADGGSWGLSNLPQDQMSRTISVRASNIVEPEPIPAQEQPVENSTTCEKCDRKLTRKPADRHNWYDLTGSTRCEATDYKLRHSPQKGKP